MAPRRTSERDPPSDASASECASRNGLRAYGHASGADIPSLFDSVREHLELGYKSIRIQTAVPGIKAVYGVAAQAQASGERYDLSLIHI